MSNEVVNVAGVPSIIVNGQTVALPSYATGHTVDNDFGKIGGLPTISPFSTTTFKIRVQDKEKVVAAPLKVVILGVTPKGTANNRAYYKAQYVPGQITAPDCSSSDGIVPDEGDLRATPGWPTTCAACPLAVFGSSVTGKGQACSQGKTMFVVPETDLDGAVYQIRVAPTSLKPVAAYGSFLAGLGMPPAMVITSLGLTPEVESQKTYPILHLEIAGVLPEAAALKSDARSKSPEIIGMTVVPGAAPALPAPTAQAAPAIAAPAGETVGSFGPEVTQEAPPVVDQAAAQEALIAQRVAEQVAAQMAAAQPPAAQVSAGFVAPETTTVYQAPAPSEPVAGQPKQDLDSEGQPWNADIHSSGKTKIKNGTWKKKKGVSADAIAAATGGPTAAEKEAEAMRQTETAAPQTDAGAAGEGAELSDILNSWQ